MASEDVRIIASGKNDNSNDVVSPQIGVFVTADVRIVQYRSSDSLGNRDSTKCTIVTSLSAVINKSVSKSLTCQHSSGSRECIAGTIKTPVLSKETYDHPVVRRSKKHTRLNSINISEFSAGRRAQIERTVLLPYLGCTRRFEVFRSYDAHVKCSKSWEAVGKSNKAKNVKPFLSEIFNIERSINKVSSDLNCQDLNTNEQLVNSFQEYELLDTGLNILEQPVRSFYLIKTTTSGAKTFSNCNNTVEKAYKEGLKNYYSRNPAVSYVKKNKLSNSITGFKEKIFTSDKLSLKKTRNVSILHRPKTRDKSTSTTSLKGCNIGQDLDKSIQGLLLPYITNGREFPSEIVLKLVPKAEALKNSSNANTKQVNRTNSSEVNLLAPILNSTETKRKKKSGNSFWNCFSKKKNTTDDATSDDTSNKEVYFPSIVEVHNKSKKLNDQRNSVGNNSVGSFYDVEETNKQS